MMPEQIETASAPSTAAASASPPVRMRDPPRGASPGTRRARRARGMLEAYCELSANNAVWPMSSPGSNGRVSMEYTHVFAGVAVADFPGAAAWYERLLGRPPDLVPNWNEVAWQITETGWIYIVGDSTRA